MWFIRMTLNFIKYNLNLSGHFNPNSKTFKFDTLILDKFSKGFCIVPLFFQSKNTGPWTLHIFPTSRFGQLSKSEGTKNVKKGVLGFGIRISKMEINPGVRCKKRFGNLLAHTLHRIYFAINKTQCWYEINDSKYCLTPTTGWWDQSGVMKACFVS